MGNKQQAYLGATLTLDGFGYAGELMQFSPPELKEKTEKYRGGNMIGETDVFVGIEPMAATFKLSRHDVNIHVVQAVLGRHAVFIFRAATDEFGKRSSIKWIIDGRITGNAYGDVKPGAIVENTHSVSVYRYLKMIDDVPVEMVNFETGELAFNGVDIIESVRDLIGL